MQTFHIQGHSFQELSLPGFTPKVRKHNFQQRQVNFVFKGEKYCSLSSNQIIIIIKFIKKHTKHKLEQINTIILEGNLLHNGNHCLSVLIH